MDGTKVWGEMMNDKEIEAAILNSIKNGKAKFSQISKEIFPDDNFHALDLALQRLRKRGDIAFVNGNWKLTNNQQGTLQENQTETVK